MSGHTKFAVGDAALVYRLNGFPSVEGQVVIAGPARAPNLYPVRFVGERRARLRFVHGGAWQSDSQAIIAGLRDHWRVFHDPALLADFDVFDPP